MPCKGNDRCARLETIGPSTVPPHAWRTGVDLRRVRLCRKIFLSICPPPQAGTIPKGKTSLDEFFMRNSADVKSPKDFRNFLQFRERFEKIEIQNLFPERLVEPLDVRILRGLARLDELKSKLTPFFSLQSAISTEISSGPLSILSLAGSPCQTTIRSKPARFLPPAGSYPPRSPNTRD